MAMVRQDHNMGGTMLTEHISEVERQYYYMEQCHSWIKTQEEKLGRPLTASVITFGCQMNARDSEKLTGILEKIGYTIIESEKADFVIYNTCTVRENANLRVYGRLGQMKHIKKNNPGMMIALCGCMMQEPEVVEKLKKSYRHVDVIFGTHNIFKFAELIYRRITEGQMIIDIWKDTDQIVEDLPNDRKYPFKTGINIMFGCNNFCSYCIVPYVRGRERSRSPKDIIEEVKELSEKGYKEITLLGQNVNSYLRTEKEKNISFEEYEGVNSFATLLRAINKIEGIERIRFVSPHPKDFTDDVIEAIRDCEKVCKLIHLPLQSGSTQVLKVMNRKYTKEQYLNLVEKMKKNIPNLTLSTDIIVGFPGETEEDFEDTLDVVKKVKFEQVFMFIYSRRVGTPGDKMENQVPEEIKHKRFDRLKALVESQIAERNKEYVGTIQKILIEGKSKNNDEMLTGRTDSNKVVIIQGNDDLIGKVLSVEIVSEHMWYLKGKTEKE